MSNNPFADPNYGADLLTDEEKQQAAAQPQAGFKPRPQQASNPFADPNYGDEPEGRTWGEVAKDTGASVMQGFATLGGDLAWMADKATGGVVDIGFQKAADRATEYWQDKKSDQMKESSQALSEADGFTGILKTAWDRPEVAPDILASSLPYMLPTGIAGRVAGAAKGAKAATAATVGTGGLLEGANAGRETESKVLDMTAEKLSEVSPQYLQLIQNGMSHEDAAAQIANRAGLTAAVVSAPLAMLASKVTGAGKLEADFFTGQGLKGFFDTVLRESAEEMAQEASNPFGSNVGIKTQVNPDQSLAEGVPEGAALGLIAGAGQGAPMSALQNFVPPVRQPGTQGGIDSGLIQPTPTPDNPAPAPVERPDPSNGPISAAAAQMEPVQTAADLGIQFPEQQDWSQYERPAAKRGAQAERGYDGLDGLIATTERLGFTDEAAQLITARRLFQQAEQARAAGDEAMAGQYAERGNRLYQSATETNDQIRTAADQFPVPYVATGEITGGEVGPYQGGSDRKGETFDQPRRMSDPTPAALEQRQDNRLTDSGIIFGEEPADVRASREQRTADDFSARYGQEGQTPYRPTAIEGELDRSNELPPAQPRAALPPGTGQVDMGRERPERTLTPTPTEYEGVGRNVVERQAGTDTLRLENRKTITQSEMIELTRQFREAVTTKPVNRTDEQKQLIKALPKLKQQVNAGVLPITQNMQSDLDPQLAGKPIDAEWTEFAPQSGTLSVPRAQMPQVKAEHRGALVNFLNAKGVESEQIEVDPVQLKPTQQEFSPEKVDKARQHKGGERSILISSDGYVVDGHHQWMAKREKGEPVKAIQLQAPIRDLLPLVNKFPSSEQDGGAVAATGAPTAIQSIAPELRMKSDGTPFASEVAAKRSMPYKQNAEFAEVVPVDGGFAVQIDTQARDQAEAQATEATQAKSEQAKSRMFREPDTVNDDMLDAIALMGGIDRAEAEAEGIDPANFGRQAGGIRYVFPRQKGDSFDGMAERLAQYGYLDPRADRLDDLRTKLDQAINGNAKIMTPEGYEALAEKEAAAEAQLQQEHEPLADDITSDEAWAGEAYANALEQGVPAPVIDAILEQYSDDPVIALVELNDAINQSREASGTQAGESQESGSDNLEATLTASRPFTPEQAAEIWGSVDPDPEPLLSSYTESDLQAQADTRTAVEEAEARAQREAEQKDQADAEVNDFSLTGSNRPADVAAAAGQNDMFGLGGTPRAEQLAAQQQPEPETPEPVKSRVSVDTFNSWKRQGTAGTRKGWTIFKDDVRNQYALMRKTLDENAAGGGYEGADMVSGFTTRTQAEEWIDENAEQPAPQQAEPEPQPIESAVGAVDALNQRINNGEAVAVSEVRRIFEYVAGNQETVKAELNKLKKDELKRLVSGHVWSDTKKAELVDRAYDSLIGDFRFIGNESGVVTSTGFGAENRLNQAREHVNALTDEQVAEYAKNRKAMIDERMAERKQRIEALRNPQTLQEYRESIRVLGMDKLTPEQRATYDRLVAEETMAQRQPQPERAGLQTDEQVELGEPTEGTHGKTGETIFNVKVITRLGKEQFKESAAFARSMGGGYYRGNFYFKSREDAELFSGWVNGDNVDLADRNQQRQEQKQANAADKLKTMADRIEQQANEALNADRKENTAKRMREADSARANAAKDARLAEIMRRVADSDSPLLKGMTQKVQVELMEKLARSLKYNAPRDMTETDSNGDLRFKDEISDEMRVADARMPIVDMYSSVASDLANGMIKTKGFVLHGRRLAKQVKDTKANMVALDRALAEKVVSYIEAYSGKYATDRDTAADFKRLQRMGITNRPTLRAALLEYMRASQGAGQPVQQNRLQTLERDLQRTIVGNRNAFNDFFPTPEAVASEVVAQAEIEPGMRVLEPSAGNGMLADAAKAAGAEVDVVEMGGQLREILSEKGYTLVGDDFLEYQAGEQYDRILMNPPFSKDQDIEHVSHAYDQLKPGGKLVAIVSSMAGDRANTRNRQFREWLDSLDAVEQPLPEGAFLSSMNQTGVNTKVLVIEKPVSDTETAPQAEASSNNEATGASTESPQGDLPPILKLTRTRYINQEAKAQGIKKGSPGYAGAIARIEDEYEADLDKAYASISFEQYNALNSDTPESLNRQAWEGLREAFWQPENDTRFSRTPETRSLTKSIQDQYPGVKLRLAENDSQIELALIDVPQDQREQGIGSAIMSRLVEHADKEGKALVLSPSAEFGGNKARLTEWYKRFGFVENKGKNRDYEVSETMYRPARFSRVDAELDMSYAARMQRALDQGFVQSIDELYEVKAREQGRDRIHQGGQEGERYTPDARSAGTAADRPQTFYHGTAADIERFDLGHSGRKDSGWLGEGIYLTDQPDLANHYAKIKAGGSGGNVMPVMVRLQNPYIASLSDKARLQGAAPEETRAFTKRLQELGYDGAILAFADVKEIVAFEPAQVRSTNAAFDPELSSESDILLSRADNAGLTISRDQVEVTATRITANWTNAPEMVTVATDRDLPADMQERIDKQNARGKIDGVFHKGRFYLIADKIRTEADVERIVLHEALGHYGLRQLYGPAFGMHMDRLFNRVGGYPGIQRLGKKYGFDLSSYWENAGDMSLAERREMMADELIAHIAGTGTVQPDLIQQIAHLIRKGLRKIMAGTRFAERLDQMTDVEVLRIVAAARKAVVEGESRITVLTHDPRFVRDFETIVYGDARFSRVPDDAPVIETDGGTIAKGKTVKEMALRAREYARKHFAGRTVRNEDHGDDITIPMSGVRHTTFNAGEALLKTVAITPEILETSVYLGSEPDKSGNRNIKSVHYYGLKVAVDGELHDVVAVVKEDDKGHRYYDHSIERKTGSDAHLISTKGASEPGAVEPTDPVSNSGVLSAAEVDNNTSTDSIEDDQDVRFSRTESSDFAKPEETHLKVALRKIADKFQVLKDLQKNIQDAGGTVNESNDAYLAEELFHGKTEEDLRQMRETFIKPLADKMAKFGIEQKDLDQYLYAKHAPERNAHIAEINPELQEAGSGMSDAKAAEIIQQVRESGKLEQYEQLAGMVYDMLETRRESMRSAGLEEDGMIDAWESKYEYYVPLKGWAVDEQQDSMARTGSGFNIAGKESKRAMGRSSEAASPSSYAIQDLTETLIRRRKNEVGNALLKLVEDNPNKEYWQVFTNENPDIDRQIFRSETEASKQARAAAKKAGQPEPTRQYQETVRETPIPMAMMSDKYFQTKRNGQTYFIKLEDERLMKAMKNIGPDTSNFLIRKLGAVNRVLSSLNTSYNPEFVVGNFARDVQTAVLNLMAEQSRDDGKALGEKIAKQTVKDIPKAMKAVYRGLRNKDEAKGGEWQKWFSEFREAGAKTGWFDMKDIDGQAADLQSLISMAKGGVKGNAMKWFKATGQMVEDLNGSVENAVRLSAYVNARKAGISQAKAASLAKNMTVNFNRRGEVGTTLNALYMFANASIQGSMNFARTMVGLKGQKGDPVWQRLNTAQKVAAGLVMGSYAIAMMNRAGAGEDDDGENWYDKVPNYVKERNLVIMKSLLGGEQDGSYWTIPLPYGYNIFHVLGNALEGTTNGNTSIGKAVTDLTLATLGSFSPIGFQESQSLSGTIARNVTPTIGKPIADVVANENFMGTSIYNENFPFGTPKPESQLGRRSTPEGYKAIAEFLNDVSGGSQWRSGYIDINPDVMRYVANYFTGAAGKFVFDKAPNNLYHLATLTPIESREALLYSRVSGKVLPYADREAFYSRRDEIGQIEAEWKGLTGSERMRFYRDNRDILALRPLMKSTEKQLKLIRQQRDRIYALDLPRREQEARMEVIEARMKRVIDQFNRRYREANGDD